MAIDFYYLNEKEYKKPIFQIEESDLLIVDGSLIKLQRLTGVNLDAYGKTRIYSDHVKLWLNLLGEILENDSNIKNKNIKVMNLLNFIKETVKVNKGLMVIGD